MRKKLGQHFLIDQTVVARILSLARITPTDRVLEIGPGKGVLTYPLAEQVCQLTAIEYDPLLAEALQKRFADHAHVRILYGDARYIEYSDVFPAEASPRQRVKIVANLPYYAATPIMLALFLHRKHFGMGTFMFQKEVAERLTASPGSKAYGSLSVITQFYSEPYYGFSVPPQAFHPQPKVDSAVITVHIHETPPIHVDDQDFFTRLVKQAFSTRRKTLKNALTKGTSAICTLTQLQHACSELELDDRIRGTKKLSVEDFANLCNILIRLQHPERKEKQCAKLF